MRPTKLIHTFLHSSKSPFIVIALALILVSPSLLSGLVADDYVHYALLNGGNIVEQRDDLSLFDLYSFIDGSAVRNRQLMDFSLIPWWTVEHLKYNFWRPLSELFHYVDYVIFTDYPWAMHAQSILWFLLCLVLLFKLYQTLFQQHAYAVLALGLFALDSTHGSTISWIANRNALIAASFAILVLLQHIRFRNSHKLADLCLALVFLVCCLLSAEAGIAVGAYLLAYSLFIDKQGFTRGFLSLIPYGMIVILWWLIYKHYGYGASGSIQYYIDPVENPFEFVKALFERIPLFFSSQFGFLPAESVSFGEPVRHFATATGIVLIGLLLFLLRYTQQKKLAGFFLVGSFLAMFPITASIPQDRNLFLIGLGGSGLTSILILDLWQQRSTHKNLGRYVINICVILFVAIHLVLSPLVLPLMSMAPKIMSAGARHAIDQLEDNLTHKKLILINAPMEEVSYLQAMLFQQHRGLPDNIWNLSSNLVNTKVTRISDQQLMIRPEGGFLQDSDQLVRNVPTDPMHEGQSIALSGATIRVIELLDDGRPAAITVDFDRSLDSDNYSLFYWQDRSYHALSLPIGTSITVSGVKTSARS